MRTGEETRVYRALGGAEAAALARIESTPAVPAAAAHADFALTPRVLAAAEAWPLERNERDGITVWACGGELGCGQAVGRAAAAAGDYAYAEGQLLGLVVAHLIQHHGWTREEPADG